MCLSSSSECARYNLFSGPSDSTCHVMLSKVVALMLPWCPRNGWWDAQAPELLDTLFTMGTNLLVEKLPDVWSGAGAELAVPQDEEHMTHAAKMVKQDGLLDFSQPAETLHNKVHSPRVCACPRCMQLHVVWVETNTCTVELPLPHFLFARCVFSQGSCSCMPYQGINIIMRIGYHE